jgi:uncharacterized DUF497 family protein
MRLLLNLKIKALRQVETLVNTSKHGVEYEKVWIFSNNNRKTRPHNKHNVEDRDISIHVWALMILT